MGKYERLKREVKERKNRDDKKESEKKRAKGNRRRRGGTIKVNAQRPEDLIRLEINKKKTMKINVL